MPFASTAFGKRARAVAVSPPAPLGPAQATHDVVPCLAFCSPGPPRAASRSRHLATEEGVDRFLTWNLLFGLEDGTDYTPFLPAHIVLMGKASAPGTPESTEVNHYEPKSNRAWEPTFVYGIITLSKVAHDPFRISRPHKARFHPHGWATGARELITSATGV